MNFQFIKLPVGGIFQFSKQCAESSFCRATSKLNTGGDPGNMVGRRKHKER